MTHLQHGTTEDQIERAVERKMDRLDWLYMSGSLSEAEYSSAVQKLDAWATREADYAKRVELIQGRH